MTTPYGMLRENAARAMSPCTLAAPLRKAWQVGSRKQSWLGAGSPVLAQGGRVFFSDKAGHAVAFDAASQERIWRYPWAGDLYALHERRLYVGVAEEELHAVDPANGTPIAAMACGRVDDLLGAGPYLIGHGTDYEYGGHCIWAIDWGSGRRLWTEHLAEDLSIRAACAANDFVIYSSADRRPSPSTYSLVARRLSDFQEAWRVPVEAPSGFVAVKNDLVLGCFEGQIIAHDLRTGKVAWKTAGGEIYVYGDRLYTFSKRQGQYTIVDMAGKVVARHELRPRLPKTVSESLSDVVLVTETHVFLKSDGHALLAFTRDAGKYVWSHKPPTASISGEVVGAGGRLYYRNATSRLFCFEPAP
jgi:outer membrane protein assembly factor BamB